MHIFITLRYKLKFDNKFNVCYLNYSDRNYVNFIIHISLVCKYMTVQIILGDKKIG